MSGAALAAHILIVDDLEVNRDLLARRAARLGHSHAFAVSGRFIEMRVRFTANDAGSAPVLAEIAVNSLNASCDVDLDDDIDVNDLRLIRAGISQPAAADDARDGVGNGVIDVRDVRACTLRCTRASCAAN